MTKFCELKAGELFTIKPTTGWNFLEGVVLLKIDRGIRTEAFVCPDQSSFWKGSSWSTEKRAYGNLTVERVSAPIEPVKPKRKHVKTKKVERARSLGEAKVDRVRDKEVIERLIDEGFIVRGKDKYSAYFALIEVGDNAVLILPGLNADDLLGELNLKRDTPPTLRGTLR